MNKTKKLTQGAMMLAIVGAAIVIDRMSAYWFAEFIVLFVPIVIIIYSAMYEIRDGLALCVGLLIITFLLSSFHMIYLIYIPVGIITGIVYSICLKRNMSKNALLIVALFTYLVCEVIANLIVYPLLGFPVSQSIEQAREMFDQMTTVSGMNVAQVFASGGIDIGKILIVFYIITIMVMGVMEGFMTHILSVFLLKRFKIMDLGNGSIINIRPNPVIAYIAFFAMISFMYMGRLQNKETLYYIMCSISIIGALVLYFYGYIFIALYGKMVLRRNIALLVVPISFVFPILHSLIVVTGFLYGTGPLYRYLESKVQK